MHHRSKIQAWCLTCATLIPATTVFGDHVVRSYTSRNQYDLDITHLTDFDQRRSGLIICGGAPGSKYCAPTSCTNLLAYVSSHGHPELGPGVHDWTNPTNYFLATDYIKQLGDDMLFMFSQCEGTSPFGFVSPLGWRLSQIRSDQIRSDFVITDEMWTPWNGVYLYEFAKVGVRKRAIQALCYGYYDLQTCDGDELYAERCGGHCVTVKGLHRGSDGITITLINPDNEQTNFDTQSTFQANTREVSSILNVNPFDCFGSDQDWTQINDVNVLDHADRALIDYRVSIYPVGGHSWQPYPGVVVATEIFTNWGSATPSTVTTGGSAPSGLPGQLIATPDGYPMILLRGAGGGIFVERIAQNATSLVQVSIPSTITSTIQSIGFCGDGTLGLLTAGRLYATSGIFSGNTDSDEAPLVIEWESGALPFAAGIIVPATPDPLGGPKFVHIVAQALTKLVSVCGDPSVAVTGRVIPASLGLNPAKWQDTSVWEDRNHVLWFAQLGDRHISAFRPDGSTRRVDLRVTTITGFAIDDVDNLLVVDSGTVRCFSQSSGSIIESGVAGSIFAGQQVGRGFTVDRSSSMFDQRYHTSLGWRWDGLWSTSCPADVNLDGEVTAQDLTYVLLSWGTQGGLEDVNRDGVVDAGDIGTLLGSWGTCQ